MRSAEIERITKETEIKASLCLDGGDCAVETGIGFFDHMLGAMFVHARFGLRLRVKGDLAVDGHHTVEDTGIVLGKAFAQALDSKLGIARYGSFYIPMDEALARCVVDVSGRPFLVFDDPFDGKMIGDFDSSLVTEFLRAFAFNAGITLHVSILYGKNAHHMAEAVFKALGHALKEACAITGTDILSTKGVL